MLRLSPSAKVPMLALTQVASVRGQVVLPNTGGVAFVISKAGIATLSDRAGVWDLFLDNPNGTSKRHAAGSWTLTKGATQ